MVATPAGRVAGLALTWVLLALAPGLVGCDLCWPRGGALGTCGDDDEPANDDDVADDDDATANDDDSGDDDDMADDDDDTPAPCDGIDTGGAVVDASSYSMLCVEPGSFWMGSPANDPDGRPDEAQHRVEFARPFLLGQTEVTQSLFTAVWGTSVSDCLYGCSPGHPAQSVSWILAVQWLNALSEAEGLEPVYAVNDALTDAEANWNADGYRLPTEAEWEYAARAGVEQSFSGSEVASEVAWCGGAADPPYEARPVMGKAGNAWGFFDMSGNVAEWVWDVYGDYPTTGTTLDPTGPSPTGFSRVHRGGMFAATNAVQCRVARRSSSFTSDVNWNRGFRIARSVR